MFVKKTWTDRVTEYPTRRTLTKEDGTTEIVTVARNEGTVSAEGDAFSAANMNDLEQRIADSQPALKTYTSLSQIGLSSSATLTDTWNALPLDSELYIIGNMKDSSWNLPNKYGSVYLKKTSTTGIGLLEFYDKGRYVYRMGISNTTNLPDGIWYLYNIYFKIKKTLTAGSTRITLSNSLININSTFDFYTSIYGVSPTNVAVANGSVTLEFDAQETDMKVEVRVM